MENKKARNWYWWLWLSPAVTIPTLLILYLSGWKYQITKLVCPNRPCVNLIEDAIPVILLIILSSLWHLFLLIPARNQENPFVRWHGFQMFFLVGIRTLVPTLSVLYSGDEEGVIYAVPVLIIVWLVGNIWGQRQAARGKCSFKDWFEKKDESVLSEPTIKLPLATIQDLGTLKKIIRFSDDPRERKSATNALVELGVVEYFDGTPVERAPASIQPTTRSKSGLWVVGAISVLLLLCFVISLINAISRANYQARALETQQVRLTATAAVAPSSMKTIQAELERAQNWPVVISYSFDSNKKGWAIGHQENDSVSLDSAIQEGVYRIDATAKQDFIWWELSPTDPVSDFYLSVDAQKPKGSFFATFGLIFRESGSNFYAFRTNGSGGVYVNIFIADRWESLKGNRPWEQIITNGEFTRLSVLAKGNHFFFFANDEFIGQSIHHQLKSGRVGIIIEGVDLVEQNIFEFDNFELRAP